MGEVIGELIGLALYGFFRLTKFYGVTFVGVVMIILSIMFRFSFLTGIGILFLVIGIIGIVATTLYKSEKKKRKRKKSYNIGLIKDTIRRMADESEDFNRIDIRKVAKELNVPLEELSTIIIKMINEAELNAEYFKSTGTLVVFENFENFNEIDKLIQEYEEWEVKTE